jgi:hypothetical protein
MTATRSGVLGHDKGAATIRLRLGTLRDDPPHSRVWDWTSIGPYEVICLACGDDASLNYSEVPPEIQAIRGNHVTAEDARAALTEHIRVHTSPAERR